MTNSAVRALGAGLALLALLSACASAPAVREEDERARIAREGPQATLDRAKALYDEGEGERAQAILEILLASPSGRKVEPEILFAIGRIEFERGRYDAAAARLDRGLRDYPNSDAAFETQWLLARVHTRRGHPELSVPLLKSLRRQGLTDGEKGRLNQDFAEAYEVAGNPMTALWWYQRADPLLATEAEREDARERVRRIVEEKLSPEQLPEVAYLYRDNLIGDLASERLAALRAEPATPLYDMTGSPAADYTLPTGPVEGAIGVILPLTGPQASYGARLLRAVLLAGGAFRADDDGPIVELVLKDSKGTAEGAARAARALADDERVAAIVGPVVPAAAQSAAEVAESAGVPMITLTPAAGVTAVGPHIFRQYLMAWDQAEATADYAVRTLGLRRFAILYPNDPYGESFMQPFWYALVERGGEVVSAVGYDIDQTDFGEEIDHLVGPFYEGFRGERFEKRGLADFRLFPGFDAIYIPDEYARVGLIASQLAYHEIRGVRLLGNNGWNDEQIFQAAGDQLEGGIFVDGFFASDSAPAVQSFVERFTAAHGFAPGAAEAEAYDAVRMLIWALGPGGGPGREAVRGAVASIAGFPGVAGTVAFDGAGDGHRGLRFLQIRRREIVEAGTATGADEGEVPPADQGGIPPDDGFVQPAPDDGLGAPR